MIWLEINSVLMSFSVSVIVFIAFMNFIPLTRRAGNFLLVILVLSCCSITFIGIAIFSKPYTAQSPLPLNIQQRYSFNGTKTIEMSQLISSDLMNLVTASHMKRGFQNNQTTINSESVLTISTRFPYSIRRVLERMNQTSSLSCVEEMNQCSFPVDPPNIQLPFLNLTSTQFNATHLKTVIEAITPGSFVHSFSFPFEVHLVLFDCVFREREREDTVSYRCLV
jgi:hypothetical protein